MLLVDIGNTALKWRTLGTVSGTVKAVYHQRRWSEALLSVVSQLEDTPEQILIGSVAGRDNDRDMQDRVRQAFGVTPQFTYACARQLGVVNAYAEPRRLGVDRWLAMIESFHRFGPSLIVDAGSALTIDMVDGQGVHHGGYIVPGIGMQHQSLYGATADVKGAVALGQMGFGASTEACVNNGVWQMALGLVSAAWRDAEVLNGAPVSLVMTGGDHNAIADQYAQANRCPNLVLDGLARIARESGA